MNLKHNVSNLPLEGIDASFEVKAETVEAELVKADAGELRLATPLTGDLRLEPSGGHKFLARGWIAAKLRVACSRCLAEFDYPVSEEVMEVFTKKPVDLDTEELKAEASDQEFFSGDDLDLWPIVLEHMVLGAPIKPLCREDCRGICPKCGQDLNLGPCGCEKKTGHPGLAGLEALRDILPKG